MSNYTHEPTNHVEESVRRRHSVNSCPLIAGRCYSFLYPARNVSGCSSNLEFRVLLVASVRDLETSPLDPLTLELSPNLKRDRFLITGRDAEHRERSFYFQSMHNVRRIRSNKFDALQPLFAVNDQGRIIAQFRSQRRAEWFLKTWNTSTAIILRVLPRK